jgi:hypothetical protein
VPYPPAGRFPKNFTVSIEGNQPFSQSAIRRTPAGRNRRGLHHLFRHRKRRLPKAEPKDLFAALCQVGAAFVDTQRKGFSLRMSRSSCTETEFEAIVKNTFFNV